MNQTTNIKSWNSTGKIGRIGRHLAETHRHEGHRGFGQMPPDASDFPGGIPAKTLILFGSVRFQRYVSGKGYRPLTETSPG